VKKRGPLAAVAVLTIVWLAIHRRRAAIDAAFASKP
jgi:hypothetical protein